MQMLIFFMDSRTSNLSQWESLKDNWATLKTLNIFRIYPVLNVPDTSNILSFHRLGRPGGMNPVCFLRSTMRRSIFSSRSIIRTTETSMTGSRRTVTMDLCSTIHNCLASSSDNPWTWKRKKDHKALKNSQTALKLWLVLSHTNG